MYICEIPYKIYISWQTGSKNIIFIVLFSPDVQTSWPDVANLGRIFRTMSMNKIAWGPKMGFQNFSLKQI